MPSLDEEGIYELKSKELHINSRTVLSRKQTSNSVRFYSLINVNIFYLKYTRAHMEREI